jgi:CRP/FNR family cyclic AMP-dependent transcriptional regulator
MKSDGEPARALLSRVGWLSKTPETFRLDVLTRCQLRRYRRGQAIFRCGDRPRGLYGLAAGGARLEMATEEDGPIYSHFVQVGQWCGEIAVLTGDAHLPNLIAASNPTVMLHLPSQAIDEIVKANAEAWRWFGLLAALNLRLAMVATLDLMIRSPLQRCIAVLLRLGDRRTGGDAPSEIRVTHGELALMANLSRTTLAPLLQRLQRDGLIKLRYGTLMLCDPAGLRALLTDEESRAAHKLAQSATHPSAFELPTQGRPGPPRAQERSSAAAKRQI